MSLEQRIAPVLLNASLHKKNEVCGVMFRSVQSHQQLHHLIQTLCSLETSVIHLSLLFSEQGLTFWNGTCKLVWKSRSNIQKRLVMPLDASNDRVPTVLSQQHLVGNHFLEETHSDPTSKRAEQFRAMSCLRHGRVRGAKDSTNGAMLSTPGWIRAAPLWNWVSVAVIQEHIQGLWMTMVSRIGSAQMTHFGEVAPHVAGRYGLGPNLSGCCGRHTCDEGAPLADCCEGQESPFWRVPWVGLVSLVLPHGKCWFKESICFCKSCQASRLLALHRS